MCDHDHDRQTCRHAGNAHLTRRRVVSGLAAGSVAALAGCLGDEEEVQNPIALDGSKQCDVCGMIIEDTFGPNGQVFFEDEYPEGRDGPAWYDSLRELYTDTFAQAHTEPVVTYVTDYSTVEYDFEERDDTTHITGVVGAETFIEDEEAVFVVESGVEGVMGPDLLPFGVAGDAEAFAEEHGGRVLESEDITPELVDSL